MYIFDEPSSFLDLKQRLEMSDAIQSLLVERDHKCYVMVVEHDLTVLNHVSDAVCCLYGEPGAYGVVSQRVGVRNGINQFLKGFLPGDNVRFRADELTFWASTASAMQEEVASAAVGKGAAEDGGKGVAEDGGAKIVMGAAREAHGEAHQHVLPGNGEGAHARGDRGEGAEGAGDERGQDGG